MQAGEIVCTNKVTRQFVQAISPAIRRRRYRCHLPGCCTWGLGWEGHESCTVRDLLVVAENRTERVEEGRLIFHEKVPVFQCDSFGSCDLLHRGQIDIFFFCNEEIHWRSTLWTSDVTAAFAEAAFAVDTPAAHSFFLDTRSSFSFGEPGVKTAQFSSCPPSKHLRLPAEGGEDGRRFGLAGPETRRRPLRMNEEPTS